MKLLPIIEALRYSPFPEAFLLLIAAMAVASGSVWLTFLHDSWLYLIFGILIAAGLLYFPLLISVGLFLLWKNPEKYKEREMKRRRREREEYERNND